MPTPPPCDSALSVTRRRRAHHREVFQRLRAAGVLPDARFQVSLPTPMAPIRLHFDASVQAAVEPVYEAAMLRELELITDAVPHDRLSIQWDTAVEFGMLEGVFPSWIPDLERGVLDRLIRLGDVVPADVEVGYHLCYGDSGHRHFVEPKDTGRLVTVANALADGLTHPLAWIHLPVPIGRTDPAYFAPLRDLRLPARTELYLGLVHATDGEDGARRRIDAALTAVDAFGVATECGLGAHRSPYRGCSPCTRRWPDSRPDHVRRRCPPGPGRTSSVSFGHRTVSRDGDGLRSRPWAAEALSGRVLVNLSSDTPDQARAAATVGGRTRRHPPHRRCADPAIGHRTARIVHLLQRPARGVRSPPGDPGSAHRNRLPGRRSESGRALLPAQHGHVLDQHAELAAHPRGGPGQRHHRQGTAALRHVRAGSAAIPGVLHRPIDAGEHPGDVDRLAMGVASIEHVAHTTRDSGIDPTLPETVLEIFRRGVAAGHGGDSFTSLINIFKKTAA